MRRPDWAHVSRMGPPGRAVCRLVAARRLAVDSRTPVAAPEPVPVAPGCGDQPWFLLRETDIRAAYRLLFYRDPTPGELEQHLEAARASTEYDLYHFGDLMLSNPERAAAVAGLGAPRPGQLDGLTFHYRAHDTTLGAWVPFHGTYETEVARAIERLLPPGGTYVDVGANIGLHAIRAARAVGRDGRVHCYEPNPGNVELLHLTMAANQFNQVTIRPVAVSDEPGEVPLHARRGQSNASVEVGPIRWDSDLQATIPCVRLDDDLSALDRLDVLKIDIEGFEPRAFAGMAETLRRFKPHILLEFFPDALRRTGGVEPAEFLAMVQGFGYQLKPFIPGGGDPTEVHRIESVATLPAQHRINHIDVLAEPVDRS